MAKNELNFPKAVYVYNEGVDEFKQKDFLKFIKDNFSGLKPKVIKQQKPITCSDGIVLNLSKTQKLFEKSKVKDKEAVHVILTKRLLATPEQDRRLHIRTAVFSDPSIVSSAGIVEGPAKPRDYYLLKTRYDSLGLWNLKEEGVKKEFKSRFIDYADVRINEVIKGLVSQAIFFYTTGEPFCDKKACRLFNAHWQEDLIYSQIKKATFCLRHKKMLKRMKT